MEELIDYKGVKAILNLIEKTDFKKFSIYRLGSSRQKAPIYESETLKTANACKEAFKNWALFSNPNQLYEMFLSEGTGNAKQKAICFTFMLEDKPQRQETAPPQQAIQGITPETLNLHLENQRLKIEADHRAKEMEDFVRRLEELEQEEEEQEETNPLLAVGMALANKILENQGQAPIDRTTINGTEEQQRIEKAITILHRNDAMLVTDLEKLANISETQPATFNMVLTTLRNF